MAAVTKDFLKRKDRLIVADELEADWKQVRVEAAPAGDGYRDPVWGTQATGGSTSIRHMYEPLRKAGAAAREMLIAAAAMEWGIHAGECQADLGKVRHPLTKRAMTYGELCLKVKWGQGEDPGMNTESLERIFLGKLDQEGIKARDDGVENLYITDSMYLFRSRPQEF